MSVLPSLYDYYTGGGISSGLTYDSTQFYLNRKPITLYSGSFHYYNIPPDNWQSGLRKARAAGLNAIETYVPWNLHELNENEYDFGNGTTDMSDFLNLQRFLTLAKQEDLFVLMRPGPYICSEWEFGGLPSWLLKYPNIKVRTNDTNYMNSVEKYFKVLFSILTLFQFTTKAGPIIAFQVENEYGSYGQKYMDPNYLHSLKKLMISFGVTELLFMSDGPDPGRNVTSLDGVLKTVNFGGNPKKSLDTLKTYQPDKPFMVTEYWIGWFNHWGDKKISKVNSEAVAKTLQDILDYPSSVNLYMFYGGTNWGFLNGANIVNNQYSPDITSYDYDAPISENGNYTEKYDRIKEIIAKNNKIKTRLPEKPIINSCTAYETLNADSYIDLYKLIKRVMAKTKYRNQKLQSMENYGQNFGYIVYRKTGLNIPKNSRLEIKGRVHDSVLVLINGILINDNPLRDVSDYEKFGYWKLKNSILQFNNSQMYTNATLDLVVENHGRVNFGYLPQFNEKKGLWEGDVLLNSVKLEQWDVGNLPFNKSWQRRYLKKFGAREPIKSPLFIKFILNIPKKSVIGDTFIDMTNWNKGFVIVNRFVLGRHCILGPQLSLYLPAAFLKHGRNRIIVFDHFERNAAQLRFSATPIST